MFVIRTFSDELSAGIAQAVLEANGVESVLIRDDASGALPFLNTLHPVRLAVREADVTLAMELLTTDAEPDEGPDAA